MEGFVDWWIDEGGGRGCVREVRWGEGEDVLCGGEEMIGVDERTRLWRGGVDGFGGGEGELARGVVVVWGPARGVVGCSA